MPRVGVDGCRAGWIAVTASPGQEPASAVFTSFAALLAALPDEAVIAVDMPIGLPEFTGRGGRGPEALVRPLLGSRRSSVYSIPSRAAVYAGAEAVTAPPAWYAAHRSASDVARRTSDPPRGVSIQAFGIFAKIREIDRLLIARPELRSRIYESHPELAFTQLNGGSPMAQPKKIGGRVNPAGMAERKALLCRHGLARDFLGSASPRGAAADDFLDACALFLVAGRILRGEAKAFPEPPAVDSFGIPVAIWA